VSEWLQGPGSEAYEADDKVGFFRSMNRCYAAIAAWQRWHGNKPSNEHRLSAGKSFSFSKEKKVLGERESKAILARYGIQSAPERQAKNAGRPSRREELGFRWCSGHGDIERKTEAGAVRLDLRDEAALRPPAPR
jgi:acyl-CoA synthetase (NDP forming)